MAVVTVTENPEDEAFEEIQTLDPLYYQLVKDTVQVEYNTVDVHDVKVDEALGDEAMGDEEAIDDEADIEDDEAEVIETVVEEIICDDKDDVKNETPVQIAIDHNYQSVPNVIVKPIQDSSKITFDKNVDRTFSNIGVIHLNFDKPGEYIFSISHSNLGLPSFPTVLLALVGHGSVN